MSDAPKPLDLEAITARRESVRTAPSGYLYGLCAGASLDDVDPLVAELKRLREALKNIRDIEEYTKGRPCTCSGVGCVQCIARLTLEGREGELFS